MKDHKEVIGAVNNLYTCVLVQIISLVSLPLSFQPNDTAKAGRAVWTDLAEYGSDLGESL